MKQKIKILLTIPLLLLLFKACKPDKGCTDGNYYKYIDEYDFRKIPYKDYSELTFLNKKSNDTIIYKGQGNQFTFIKFIEPGECPQTNNLQYRSLTFINNKNNEKIIVENKFITLGVSNIGITYKNFGKNFYASEIRKPYTLDSMIIQGVKYYNVEYLKDELPYPSFLSIYYNLDYGILKLETNNGDTLELIKLEL
jgi:hypothetical protein